MTHDAKVQALRRQLARHGIRPATATPLLWRLLWQLGVPLSPPHFLGFLPLVLVCGGAFGTGWGVLMYLLAGRTQQVPPAYMLGAALAAGSLFGLIQAAVFRRQAARLQLPAWPDYAGAP